MLSDKLKKHKIILASGSPRRQQFLKEMGLDFEIRSKEIEEVFPSHLKEVEITDYLSKLKANAFVNELKEMEILITSDTIVWHQNKALGKPKDVDNSKEILSSLSDSTHKVITSVCFTTNKFSKIIHDTTEVSFKKLSKSEIDFYITNYQPMDKAGSYGIQDWLGLVAVTEIKGSYTNVMGFPTNKVAVFLEDNF